MIPESNTRSCERYRARAELSVTLFPGATVAGGVAGGLLDVNERGGVGLAVRRQERFERMNCRTFLEPWTLVRLTSRGPVHLPLRFLQGVACEVGGLRTVRFSGHAGSPPSARPSEATTANAGRRQSRRRAVPGLPARVTRIDRHFLGHVQNVGDDGGLALSVEPHELEKVRWTDFFATEGSWIEVEERILPCRFTRIGISQSRAVIAMKTDGLLAPESSTPDESATSPHLRGIPGFFS